MRFLSSIIAASAVALSLTQGISGVGVGPLGPVPQNIKDVVNQIDHLIVLYFENQSFDGLFPFYPGAEGLQNFALQTGQFKYPQKNKFGNVYDNANADPARWFPGNTGGEAGLTQDVAKTLPNAPFDALNGPFKVKASDAWGDITHRFFEEQYQIGNDANATGGCRMDSFVAYTDASALVMGFYDQTNNSIGQIAQTGVLLDHFHHSAFGGSYLNHQFLISAQAQQYATGLKTQVTLTVPLVVPVNGANNVSVTVPASIFPAGKADGSNATIFYPFYDVELMKNGQPAMVGSLPIYSANPGPSPTLTPDDYVVNTMYPPVPLSMRPPNTYAPFYVSGTTIGDVLTDAGISWAWYAESYNLYLSDPTYASASAKHNFSNPLALHHQPFLFFQRFSDLNSADSKAHLKDDTDFLAALKSGTGLPSVSFVKPNSGDDYHPGYSGGSVAGGEKLMEYVNAIKTSSYWNKAAVLITFDENGGRFDHVCPPVGDRWGPGLRVPSILLSPYVKPGTVDKTQYETLSFLRLITTRFNLSVDILEKNAPARSPLVNDLAFAFSAGTPTPMSSSSSTGVHKSASTVSSPGMALAAIVMFSALFAIQANHMGSSTHARKHFEYSN